MQDLPAVESLPFNSGTSTVYINSSSATSLPIAYLQELHPAEAQASVGDSRHQAPEPREHRMKEPDSGVEINYSDVQSETRTRRLAETPQWPSESAILVAVRVRPFSAEEQGLLPQAPTNKFNFSADASLSAGAGYGHSRGDNHDLSNSIGSKGSSGPGIRRVVEVLDDSVLVFDPPDAESISKYKRALLPVQAYRRFKDMRYAFDRVFHEDAQQQEVFENTTRHLIDGVLNGYNGTLFAYGATGCGKTHTISGTPEKPGIIFLTMQELYDRMKELEDEKTIEISLSYLEVYNETIRDLLVKPNNDAARPPSLHLREDSAKKISIAGLSEHHPKGMNAVMDLIMLGNENRTMSPTEANATSSRSHAVLQINICQRLKTADVSEDFTVATLSLIDLAGSERASVTKNRGSRLIEGANINKSLLALGNCINALCDNKPKSHIPYRDSKLTRLLKFSLGGNCKTVMIACVSPSSRHYEETHNTLKYANRAKNIKTKVTKNTLNVDRHVSEYVQAIYELRQEVAELKSKLANQAKSREIEKAQQRQEILGREFEDTIRKMRATFQASRAQETSYAKLQSQLFIVSAQLSGLYRWRTGFDEASQEAKKLHQQVEQRRVSQAGQDEQIDRLALEARAQKLSSSLSASTSYINMVDQLINDLNEQTLVLTKLMQEQEDAMKLYAVSIQALETQSNPITSGFPYERLYELEKKYQTLQSHNKILTTKLELSDKSLGEQFQATEDFMELSARSLVGLRPEIETIEQAGIPTKTLNDIYMSSITSFTDMTKRIGSSLSQDQQPRPFGRGASASHLDNKPQPESPLRQRSADSASIGLKGSRMMSMFPEVPQTPVKRHATSHVLPNLSMDTVDTNLVLGSSSLFGDQSPIRMYQDRHQMGSPQNPFHVTPMSPKVTTPRRKSTPMAGVLFSPKRRRARGGLRPTGLAPTPTKRTVNFLLDVVAEDDERYMTGLRDPSIPSIQSPPEFGSSSPSVHLVSRFSLGFEPSSSVGRGGMAGGARRLVPTGNGGGSGSNAKTGARRLAASNSSNGGGAGSSVSKAGRGELSKGAQRIAPPSLGSASSNTTSHEFASPTKRLRQPENDPQPSNGKRLRGSPAVNSTPVHALSAATAARIARRQSMMSDTVGNNPFHVVDSTIPANMELTGDTPMTSSPPNPAVSGKNSNSRWPNGMWSTRGSAAPTEQDSSVPSPGLSRIPIPSPPSNSSSKAARGTETAEQGKSMIKEHNFSSLSNPVSVLSSKSAATRRRSMGVGSGSALDTANRTALGDNKPDLGRHGPGSGIGGGPIRDAGLRRRARAKVSPPRDIPSYGQLTGRNGTDTQAENGALSDDRTQMSNLEAMRAKRRVSMMAAPPGTRVGSYTDSGDDGSMRSTTIPVPVNGSSRRRSLGLSRTVPAQNDAVPAKSANRRRSMFAGFDTVSTTTLPGAAGGFGFGLTGTLPNVQRNQQSTEKSPAEKSSEEHHVSEEEVFLPIEGFTTSAKTNVKPSDHAPDLLTAYEPSEATAALIARLRQKRNATLPALASNLDPATDLTLAKLQKRPSGFGTGFDGFNGFASQVSPPAATSRPVSTNSRPSTELPGWSPESKATRLQQQDMMSGPMSNGRSSSAGITSPSMGSRISGLAISGMSIIAAVSETSHISPGFAYTDRGGDGPSEQLLAVVNKNTPASRESSVDLHGARGTATTPSPIRSISRLSLIGSPLSGAGATFSKSEVKPASPMSVSSSPSSSSVRSPSTTATNRGNPSHSSSSPLSFRLPDQDRTGFSQEEAMTMDDQESPSSGSSSGSTSSEEQGWPEESPLESESRSESVPQPEREQEERHYQREGEGEQQEQAQEQEQEQDMTDMEPESSTSALGAVSSTATSFVNRLGSFWSGIKSSDQNNGGRTEDREDL
ncbi:kinesin-like protein Klp5 [Mortierella sp. GBA30]|nr:kinesin-like protein Klp5 [Mortierella sp. GBA30]